MNNMKKEFPCESKNCPYCESLNGICTLQDYNTCMNAPTWNALYKTCPLKTRRQKKRKLYKAKLYKEYYDGMKMITHNAIIEAETIEQLHEKMLPVRNNGFRIASILNPQGQLIYVS